MENVSGNWTGTISGTNTANLFAEVRQEGNALSGIARLNDPMYGIGIYNFTGTIDGKKIQLDMTPDQSGIGRNISQTIRVGGQPVTVEYTPVHYGDIVADLEVQKDHTLSGKWTSSIGSGGTVFLRNENVILAEKGRIAQELQDRAFVMMSIQRDDAEAEDVLHSIKRATGKFDIECTRVDEVHHSGKISDLILEYIKTSKYLICDISSERPNVYYELGYAHGIEREVILIAKQGSPLHFDIKDYNTIFYRNMTELESGVEARIKAIINIDQSS